MATPITPKFATSAEGVGPVAGPVEVAAMRRALTAARGVGVRTLPNPRVGCVLLSADGATIATGVHRGAGTPHAEVDALSRAADRAAGSTAVVTLEPCNHRGRTGPCAEALVDAGVARVVVGQADPNPVAAGGSVVLRAAGVEVETGVLEQEAYELNEPWTLAVSRGRPFVTFKFAATMDGRVAANDGSSQWITGEQARADVQRLRARADAIAVGTGTVLADDPWLTVRDRDGAARPYDEQPLRVVIGLREVPGSARVRDPAAPWRQVRAHDPRTVLAELARTEVRHVWLEGGPTLAGAFVESGVVDEVVAYVAPVLLGAGMPALVSEAMPTIADALRLEPSDVTCVGRDVRITARPLPSTARGAA